MYFIHKKEDILLYEISINIKAYTPITEKDKERINKIALLIDSLGYDTNSTEQHYRFTSERENTELLLDVEDCTKQE